MYKKWLSCALSVLCSFCLFWGLYSNTLEVQAAVPSDFVSQNVYGTINFYPDNYGVTTGAITGSTGSISTSIRGGDIVHVKIPVIYRQPISSFSAFDGSSGYQRLYGYIYYYSYFVPPTFSMSGVSSYQVSNLVLTDRDGNAIKGNNEGYADVRIYQGYYCFESYSVYTSIPYYIEFDLTYAKDVDLGSNQFCTLTYSGKLGLIMRFATDQEVTDSGALASANQSLQVIEQSSQDIATSVTSDTGGGLLATIKNFFGGFFSNLINSILGLFVPDSTYFSTWFDNLNTLLSAKLGMLYAPFDLLISTLNAVYSADTTEPGITFPGITWDGETVIEPYTFYFSSLGEDFQNLRDAVYFATDVVFLFAFLHLLQKKIALVITGSEVNG